MLDKYGRRINYMRVSVTDRCNLRCIYCMPPEGIVKKDHEDIMRYEDIAKVIKAASSLGINKIRFTGGEPLILKDIDKLIYYTGKIDSIKDIAITTNGIFLYDMVDELKKLGLKRVNVSLDSLDKEKFRNITRGGDIDKVVKSIEKSLSVGIEEVKVNTVLMRGINDDEVEDFINLTKELPITIRFIELMPIGEGEEFYKKNYIDSKEILLNHKNLIPIDSQKGSTAELYKLENAKGKIGFITPMSCKFCSDCNRIRLTSEGNIKPCLNSREEISISKYIDDDLILTKKIEETIYNKPLEHFLIEDGKSRSKKKMYQIGG